MDASTNAPELWRELFVLAQNEADDEPLLERLLATWCTDHGALAAGLYCDRRGSLEQLAAAGPGLPERVETSSLRAELGAVELPGGRLLFRPPEVAPDEADPALLLLASYLKSGKLKAELKEQQFQVNYRVVELEALYDVGLAVASTLDLDKLSEEILLRAISLLDAQRGALYLHDGDQYRMDRAFGGAAAERFEASDAALAVFLADSGPAPESLLPGARFLLGAPIEVESGRRGFLAVGDKESRRGVGPFLPADRRTLSLFANQAALALENARLHLEALEKERLEREMQLAAQIQRQILPKGAPQVPGFQVAGWYRPAREVGGDYYDLFHLGPGRLGVVLGDVSGKGIPAALLVSTLHSALRLLLEGASFGPELFERLNRHILESSLASKFITMTLGELDLASGTFSYLNAGHNPGLLVRRRGPVEELGAGGVPLGLLPGSLYQPAAVTFEPGDLLCLYSDGITEATSPTDEEFGNDRLIDLLRDHLDRPLQDLLEAIPEAVTRFAQGLPQGDDQTLVLVRRDA